MATQAERLMETSQPSSFETLRKRVRAAWERDRTINTHSSALELIPGPVPAISGEVPDVMVKRRAVRLARQVAPDTEMLDHILVNADPPVADRVLTRRALDLISGHRAFLYMSVTPWEPKTSSDLADWIAVDVSRGWITLHGRVNSLTHRRLAEVLAWRLPGCRDIRNLIHVEPPEQDTDGEITDAAEQALRIVLGPDADRVGVRTRGQEVTLSGVVDNPRRHHLAQEVCWSIPGVHWVHDDLAVQRMHA
jgi:BON domain